MGIVIPIEDKFHRSTPEFRQKRTERRTLVIGIAGKARHGKDTVAEQIIYRFGGPTVLNSLPKWDIRSYGFADALKVEVFDFLQASHFCFGHHGSTYPITLPDDKRLFSLKEKLEFINSFKISLREILQKWGTEFRRAQNEKYWIEKLQKQIEEERPQVALLRDLRFANEASICDVTICVERLGYKEADESVGKHVSETELTSISFDYRISVPNGQLGLLKSEAEVVFQQIIDKFL